MKTVISDVRVVLGPPGTEQGRYDILIDGERIQSIVPAGKATPDPSARRVPGGGRVACPGFVDLHIHGGMGHDFMDATEEAFRVIGEYHAAGGITAYMPTTMTEAPEAILACFDMAAKCKEQRIGGIEILGVHAEGPYMSPKRFGCHDPGFVRPPSRDENRAFLDRAHILKRMTCAPEIPGVLDFMGDMSRQGMIASGGHSDATFQETAAAIDRGMTMITHFYSTMSSIVKVGTDRIAGMLEATLLDDRLSTELIADLRHVPKELLLLAMKSKAQDTVCFTTDATRPAGMPDGIYTIGSKRGTGAVMEKGIARNLSRTSYAGSTVRMIDLIQNAVEALGLTLEMAVRRASLIPAKIAGVADRKGTLEPGKDADIVLLDTSPRVQVYRTFGRGDVIAKAG